jgi:hypothetical protein
MPRSSVNARACSLAALPKILRKEVKILNSQYRTNTAGTVTECWRGMGAPNNLTERQIQEISEYVGRQAMHLCQFRVTAEAPWELR